MSAQCKQASLAMLLLASALSPLFAQGKKPPPEQPPLPPVRYEIQYFQHPTYPIPAAYDTPYSADYLTNRLGGLNNFGECVGNYGTPDGHQHGWYCKPSAMVQSIDLNDIGAIGIPEGWFIAHAMDINDGGAIVGYMRSSINPQIRRGFVLEMNGGPGSDTPPEVHLLPDNDENWVDTYARRINENGDVLGVFQRPDGTWGAYLYNFKNDDPQASPSIVDVNLEAPATTALNNPDPLVGLPALVVGKDHTGTVFTYSKGGGVTYLYPATGLIFVNDDGVICGSFSKTVQIRKNQTATRYYIFRDFGDGAQEAILGSESSFSIDVHDFNSHGTILMKRQYVYRDEWNFVDINALLTGTAEELSRWSGSLSAYPRMNDSGPLGYGEIAGESWSIENGLRDFYLLSPYSYP
jgi:hypothetical protein